MPLVHFSKCGMSRLGKLFGDHVIDLSIAAPKMPRSVVEFFKAGEIALKMFHAVEDLPLGRLPLAAIKLLAPVPNPEKYLGIGMNFADHAAEVKGNGVNTNSYQLWFNKQVSCITGPYDDVVKPDVTDKMDYEAELGVVIGKPCRHVSIENARSVIGGYLVVNDVSVRDWQLRTPTHTLGKSFDTHGPIGPWIALVDEILDPHDLEIRMFVNGELRQKGNTANLIHNIFEQISYLSTVMTLKPGDLLATGTPSGVGAAMNPPQFLQPGDTMRVEIEGIGQIENRVVAERSYGSKQRK